MSVALQTAPEALLARSADPDAKREVGTEGRSRGRDTFENQKRGDRHLMPLGELACGPVIALKATGLVARQRLEYLLDEPRPPVQRVIAACEVVGAEDLRILQRICASRSRATSAASVLLPAPPGPSIETTRQRMPDCAMAARAPWTTRADPIKAKATVDRSRYARWP